MGYFVIVYIILALLLTITVLTTKENVNFSDFFGMLLFTLLPGPNLICWYGAFEYDLFRKAWRKLRTKSKERFIDNSPGVIKYSGKRPPRRQIVKKLIKTVEEIPNTVIDKRMIEVVTYRLSNGEEVIEEHVQFSNMQTLYYLHNDTLSYFNGDIRIVDLGGFELDSIIENKRFEPIQPAYCGSKRRSDFDRFKKDFVEFNGEFFRVDSFKIEEVIEEIEVDCPNFKVVAKEVEVEEFIDAGGAR